MQYDVTIKILSLWRCWKIWVNGKLVNCELSTEINDQHMATTTTSKSFHRRDSDWSGGGHLVVIFSSKLRCITSLSRFLVHSEPIFGNWTPQKDPFRLPKLTSIIQKTFVCKSLKNKRNRVHVKVISIATSFFLLYVLLIVMLSFLINCHFLVQISP